VLPPLWIVLMAAMKGYWSATADSILEKLQRLSAQISGTAH
jgi:hypothetical protein